MTQLTLPSGFKISQRFQELAPLAQEDSLSAGIGQSFGVIGYKGKSWTLRYRGEKKILVRPDDGTPSSYIDVIILGNAKNKSKTLYNAYDPATSDGERPLCSSIDGIVPDPDINNPPARACALCPKNVWKVDPATGRKGRECTDYKRLAVLIAPSMTKALLGDALLEPVFLRVPPDSLQSLAIMGDNMAKQGAHFSAYLTRISFDPTKAHPKMVFQPVRGLSDEEFPVIMELRQHTLVDRIILGDTASGGLAAVRHALDAPSIVPDQTPPADFGFGLTAAKQVTNGVPPREQHTATVTQLRPEVVTAAVTTTADVGVEESSDEMDARINAMISRRA